MLPSRYTGTERRLSNCADSCDEIKRRLKLIDRSINAGGGMINNNMSAGNAMCLKGLVPSKMIEMLTIESHIEKNINVSSDPRRPTKRNAADMKTPMIPGQNIWFLLDAINALLCQAIYPTISGTM